MNRSGLPVNDSKANENQVKFAQGRVTRIEKHFGLICQTFSSITRKIARMRDKNDLLAKQVMTFAVSENFNSSTRNNLVKFAEHISTIQDYREAEVSRLEKKVVAPICVYGQICKQVKAGIKSELQAIVTEQKRAQKLDKLQRSRPGEAHQITRAATELEKAAADANIGSKAVTEQMDTFEKDKLKDLKGIMLDFVKIEIAFHAKALEYYSKCYEDISTIDEEADLDEFRGKMKDSRSGLGRDLTLSTLSSTAMSSTFASSSYTSPDSSEEDTERTPRVRINTQSMHPDDEDDDEDYDDDDYYQ